MKHLRLIAALVALALCGGICGCADSTSSTSSADGSGNSGAISADTSAASESTPVITTTTTDPTTCTFPMDEQEPTEESAQAQESEEAVEPIVRDESYEWDKVIALTFDDGPNTTTTREVLEMLKKHGVVATFFLIGDNINDESAKVVKYAYDLGCEINNHSKTHSYMSGMTAEEVKAEFDYVDERVYEITGEHTRFFRPPYIDVGDVMWENIDVPFISGIGCNDWEDKVTADRRTKVILKKVKDGSIILLHDAEGNSMTVEALDTMIPELKAQGYKFVTLTELFEEKGVEPVTQMIYSNVLQESMWG